MYEIGVITIVLLWVLHLIILTADALARFAWEFIDDEDTPLEDPWISRLYEDGDQFAGIAFGCLIGAALWPALIPIVVIAGILFGLRYMMRSYKQSIDERVKRHEAEKHGD